MKRKPPRLGRNSLLASLAVHGAMLLVMAVPLLGRGCTSRKPKQEPIFVEFTVALPPPPEAEPVPEPAPEPPPPEDDIPEPAPKKPDPPKEAPKPPEPPKPKQTKVIKQTNRVVRTASAPAQPQKSPLSAKEIEDMLRQGAKIGPVTNIPESESGKLRGAYGNKVRDRLYAAWQQPESLRNLPGLIATVRLTIQQGGDVTKSTLIKTSGNTEMDNSALKAVQTAKTMPPLPAGLKGPIDLDIEFEVAR